MTERQMWPSWRYGPEGQSQIFDHEEQVPEGWVDHPSKLAKSEQGGGSGSSSGEQRGPSQGSVASDHTLGGNDSINRGTPETHQQGGATQGGETGQPTDQTPFSLPPEGDVNKNWIIEQLNARKVPHNPRWDKSKLYGLLHDAIAPAE